MRQAGCHTAVNMTAVPAMNRGPGEVVRASRCANAQACHTP